jgi:hypothetical protein
MVAGDRRRGGGQAASDRPAPVSSLRSRVVPVVVTLLALVPALAEAWPAVQDSVGIVYLCDTRPSQLPDGRWSCRSGPGTYAGSLVEVARPGLPPGVRSSDLPPDARYRYVPYPWGPPPREPSGYDALDRWLGPQGPSDR